MNNNKTLVRVVSVAAMAATLGLFGCSSQFGTVRDSIARAQADAALSNVHCFTTAFDPRPYVCETPAF
jgi:hypothetical protein